MAALVFAVSLSACNDKTPASTETADITSVEETEEITEEIEEVEEESTPEETEEEIAEKKREKSQFVLGEMPYYGDIANCKMTAKQATAYAQLIADGLAGDFSFRGGYDEDLYDVVSWSEPFYEYDYDYPTEVDRTQVILVDFSTDGTPYLYISSSREPSSFEIYGWDGSRPILSGSGVTALRNDYRLSEQEDGTVRLVRRFYNTETSCGDEDFWAAVTCLEYAFVDGNSEQVRERVLAKPDPTENSGPFCIIQNGEPIGQCSDAEYDAFFGKEPHTHTLPYNCFYDMKPCSLEEMVNYLNTYATVMSDSQVLPVEIKKAETVKRAGTGITTKGEVSQWKIDSLEILRQYMNDELLIANGNADAASYLASGSEKFYFGLADINNDGVQELLLSYKYGEADEDGDVQIHFPPSYECLMNVYGFDSINKTYMVSQGSVCIEEIIYTYDGTSFSVLCSLQGDWNASEDGGPYTITENGKTSEISEEEFWAIENDWSNRHTRISAKNANTHLDIENIENTFQVKIDVQSSGGWVVTGVE